MGSKNCMNEACRGTTSSSEWKKGWSLKSGGFATLCYSCGSAYENSNFCDKFHAEESGWRECKICGKRVHCGCIASRYLHEYMDYGGIGCMSCVKRHEIRSMQSIQISGDIPNGTFVTNGIRDTRPIVIENRIDNDKFSTERLLQLTKAIGTNDFSTAFQQFKQEESMLQTRPSSKRILNLTQQCSPSTFLTPDNTIPKERVKDTNESLLPRPSLNFSLTPPLGSPNTIVPYSGGIVEGSELSKSNPQPGLKARQILPKPPKSSPTTGLESNKGAFSQTRIARPPAEGRGRNQLLPRYWPKITDQELQQLSGDLNSTIVPLFEKILSASDAGRIGRLVLPKACAEAYFPPINQSEGIPINIQDIKGKEWLFQFRFWPNNNSRMYVLEGVTPCIQDMQVQAGDTVIFSRIDPGGQLVIGCRKASNFDIQALQTTAIPSSNSPGETSFSGVTDNIFPNGGRTADVHMPLSEKKKARNIKNKRLLMHNDDAMELRVTWEEAQELLRPSPNAEPTFVMVEDHLFEEFEEPPIFGKRTIFTSRLSGEQEQLAQCDSCLKWRRLPVNALLSAKWTCSENIWDSKRCSCYAPEDINPRDLESIISIYKDSKKRRISDKAPKEGEPSGLDALATAAVLGDNNNNNGDIAESSSVGATTRHPRHRPGCSCIVCIQPPSGKGKHEPTCKCNVCSTVKRRFKTLMMRKKKRQSDREAELALAQMKAAAEVAGEDKDKDEDEAAPAKTGLEDIAGHVLLNMNQSDKEISKETAELDLNCDPHREEEILLAEAAGMSLTTLMNAITLPLDVYLGQNGGPSVDQQSLLPKSGATESEEIAAADGDLGQDNSRQDVGEPFKPI